MVDSNTTVYGGNEYGISSHLHIFTSLKCNIFRASFLYPITDTDSTQLKFFKVETLLNNAFKPDKRQHSFYT